MMNCAICDALSPCVLSFFQGLAVQVRDLETRVEPQCGCRQSTAFPSSAHISFLADPREDEIVVAEMNVWREERHGQSAQNNFRFECDIIRGDGQIIAEMPQSWLTGEFYAPRFVEWARERIGSAMAWLESQLPLIASTVSQRFDPGRSRRGTETGSTEG